MEKISMYVLQIYINFCNFVEKDILFRILKKQKKKSKVIYKFFCIRNSIEIKL